ncbi:hypothetical protein N7G274_002837 [Stereocaulon virgatum]|uniref:Uncharacterized protein n=1 Tax=Stereocaulon virgatum TaxID=373712 RepID=A0ABR4AK62_9LECA
MAWSPKGPQKAPEVPRRPDWKANCIVVAAQGSLRATLEAIHQTSTRWANNFDNNFRPMKRQIEELDVAEDDYIGLIWLFSDHPPRPTVPTAEDYNKVQKQLVKHFPYFHLVMFHESWNDSADKLEQTHIGMATELLRHHSIPRRAMQMVDDNGDLGMSNLSITSQTAKRKELEGILNTMFGP